LVQFYDPLYHCFTFPDYQLVPTLEEYSYWVALKVSDKVPFSGLEPIPKPSTIAATLHLETSLIKANLTTKGGLLCLPTKFLFQKASTFSKLASSDGFDSILALLIYGLVFFPNLDNFVDINAIKIFLSKNLVPTLLADKYHSIHHRTHKEGGVITCCAPLLYKWFTSHLPQSYLSIANLEKIPCSERILAVWYNAAYNTGEIIDSYGEYPNIPLLGTRGGISYNPTLARCQFGYPMKTKPDYLSSTNDFYLDQEDSSGKREKFVRAWHTILKKDRNQLGKKSNATHESYTQGVIDRAAKYKMPYNPQRLTSSTIPSSSLPIPFETKEKFQDQLTEVELERNTWKRRYQEAELEIETLKGKLEQHDNMLLTQNIRLIEKDDLLQHKDDLLRQDANMKRKHLYLFAGPHPDF